ncbi:MAG: helix-turn-helix domain-containing protein [Candidatus Bathyarchaeota archaeon]|nr:helix-turn-helix domain-containing protein [Candidatus Bathyarchaeota archaeon]
MTETDDYDLIFAALKNPIRRQILQFIEQKGEASFTDIQNVIGITDTGLLSYHLKELNLLVEQSSRGKYALSEIGQTSMTLFNKVEKEQARTRKIVQKEVDNYISAHFKASVILAALILGSFCIPLSADILVSVQTIINTLPLWQFIVLQLAAFSGAVLCLALFVWYDRRYHSKTQKTNLIHTTLFAVVMSLIVLLTGYSTYNFTQATIEISPIPTASNEILLITMILRTVAYLATAPLIVYAFNKKAKNR